MMLLLSLVVLLVGQLTRSSPWPLVGGRKPCGNENELEYNEYCYVRLNGVSNQSFSEKRCREEYEGGTLVSMHDLGEYMFVKENMRDETTFGATQASMDLWVGLVKENKADQSRKWTDDTNQTYNYPFLNDRYRYTCFRMSLYGEVFDRNCDDQFLPMCRYPLHTCYEVWGSKACSGEGYDGYCQQDGTCVCPDQSSSGWVNDLDCSNKIVNDIEDAKLTYEEWTYVVAGSAGGVVLASILLIICVVLVYCCCCGRVKKVKDMKEEFEKLIVEKKDKTKTINIDMIPIDVGKITKKTIEQILGTDRHGTVFKVKKRVVKKQEVKQAEYSMTSTWKFPIAKAQAVSSDESSDDEEEVPRTKKKKTPPPPLPRESDLGEKDADVSEKKAKTDENSERSFGSLRLGNVNQGRAKIKRKRRQKSRADFNFEELDKVRNSDVKV